MVTRITDAGTLPTQPVLKGPGGAAGSADDASGAAPSADSKNASEPAVRLHLSMTASKELAAAPAISNEALVQEIRQRLASGQFEIDYEKVGEGMLRDLIAQNLPNKVLP